VAAAGDLSGTSWQLVKIMSMDDSVYTPDDPSLYTLEFGDDGSMRVRSDCNRGSGSWSSESAGRLEFGPIAATQALCPPGSLHDRYLRQFSWVRSYVIENGNLFLATMADGSILEFAPTTETPVAATVLGEEVRTADAGEMREVIVTRLLEQYAAARGLEATEAEIDAFVENLERAEKSTALESEEELTAEEVAEIELNRRALGRSLVRGWKVNRDLYREYGGRIIAQQLGPEPLDAYRRFLEKQQREGAFAIHRKEFEAPFWRYFTDDSIHSFLEPGSRAEADAFEAAPWRIRE
jgi:heat shock protein HslJ